MAIAQRTDRTTGAAMIAAAYGAACYLAFLAAFAYGIAFLADVVVPRTVDRGGPEATTAMAVALDTLLLGIFAVQHSVMARPGFKRWWTRAVPRHVERSTYVLAASAALALAFWQWRPIPDVVWDVSAPTVRVLVSVLFAVGWAWVLAMSFAIDHLDMFGLRQVALHLRGLPDRRPGFQVPLPYRLVRQPMMLGFFPAFFATPRMTVGHLLFALLGAGYVLAGVRLEERDLTVEFPNYRAYAARTPRFIPRLPRRPGPRPDRA
jgi:protein-S-isoprenylcysteine O-methyltransferase Ste14